MAFVGVVLGFEVGIASNRPGLSVLFVAAGYLAGRRSGVVCAARLTSARADLESRLATVNSLGTPLTFARTGARLGRNRGENRLGQLACTTTRGSRRGSGCRSPLRCSSGFSSRCAERAQPPAGRRDRAASGPADRRSGSAVPARRPPAGRPRADQPIRGRGSRSPRPCWSDTAGCLGATSS